jgi:hypothetical protein
MPEQVGAIVLAILLLLVVGPSLYRNYKNAKLDRQLMEREMEESAREQQK